MFGDIDGRATRLMTLIPQCGSDVEKGSKPHTFMPFQINSDLPHLDAPITAILSSTGVATLIAAIDVDSPVTAAAVGICPG